MSQYQADEVDYMADDYEMADVDDDMDEEFRGTGMADSDSEDDEYNHWDNKITDTSSAQARRGKDIQGIPWERLSITREKYRQTRLEQYKNYENVPQSGEGSEKECIPTKKGGMYYEFQRNTRSVKSTILHFQLRNLVWATSKHDVYLMSDSAVIHWSAITCKKSEVLNVSGHVAPCEKHPGSLLEGFTQTQVSTLAAKDNLLVAGGFQGELICKHPYVYCVLVFEAMATFVGQVSVLSLVALFGAATTAMITTARKAVTLLLSYLIFTKPLTEQHGTGLLLISMGIVLKLLPDNKIPTLIPPKPAHSRKETHRKEDEKTPLV